MVSPFVAKKELVTFAKRLYDRKLVVGTDGSLSVRLDGDRIMITPSGLSFGSLEAEDPVVVDQNGKHLQGKRPASLHLAMHLAIYNRRPDARSIAHTLPAFATAFSVAGVGLDEEILPSIMVAVGKIGITDHVVATPESAVSELESVIESHSAVVMRNYGLVTIGKSIAEAFDRSEMVEQYAQILHLARQLGNVHGLPSDEFKRLELMRKRMETVWETKGRR